jgi:hypothetical protein
MALRDHAHIAQVDRGQRMQGQQPGSAHGAGRRNRLQDQRQAPVLRRDAGRHRLDLLV